jgi:hypothetical protein
MSSHAPSSYFTPAVTYGDNNNVDDTATYNDCRQGRRSPGIDSSILETTAPLRNVEVAETCISALSAKRGDSADRPPILEDSSERLGRQLPVQGICKTGEKKGVAGESAGNTPNPNAAILFESGNDEDDNIKCGQCENPIAYCHCSPTMLPPRINVDEEEGDEETPVSPAKTSDKENKLVEVRVSRGMGEETNDGGRVQVHHRRMYAPGTPQRLARHSLSPTPDGFICNWGPNYIPLRIPTTSGQGVAPAKWVKVRMGVNPTAWGCMYKGGVVYQGDVHVAPDRDHGPTPDYNNEQLLRLRSDY